MVTSEQKRNELSRGDGLLQAVEAYFPNLGIIKAADNKFHIYIEKKRAGSFIWRLQDDGFGTLNWRPAQSFIDIAPKRSMEKYNYIDNKSDLPVLFAFIEEILTDLGII